jgi:F-type H+-transporting ATPase subunit b
MLIDWFTVAAQALNFLILIWLLKRFLYKPILSAIDAREKRIELELAAAAAKQTEAQAQREELANKNKLFDEQRAALLAKVLEQSNADRARLLSDTRKEAEQLRTQYADSVQSDRARLGQQIVRLAQVEVFAIARKALTELADGQMEERMAAVFVRRLAALDADAKSLLGVALKTSADPAIVRTSIDLPTAQRDAIQKSLNEIFSAAVRLQFVTEPDTVCGIELTANGQKLAWSIADYLRSLEQKVTALQESETAAVAASPTPTPVVRTAT